MSQFLPGNYDLRTALIFCYHLKKTGSESYRVLLEAQSEHALDKSQCFEWLKKFKSGEFDVRNEERRMSLKKFEDSCHEDMKWQGTLKEVKQQLVQLNSKANEIKQHGTWSQVLTLQWEEQSLQNLTTEFEGGHLQYLLNRFNKSEIFEVVEQKIYGDVHTWEYSYTGCNSLPDFIHLYTQDFYG